MPLRPSFGRPLPVLAAIVVAISATSLISDARARPAAKSDSKSDSRSDPALAQLRKGHTAFRAGDYAGAAKLLAGLAPRLPRVRDYVLYFAGESEFFAGNPARDMEDGY